MNNWQPIETAPKDGTEILLGWDLPPHFCYGICYWGEDERDWVSSDAEWAVHTKAPTHWMPLPEPPTSSKPVKKA